MSGIKNYNYIFAEILSNPDTFSDVLRISVAGPQDHCTMLLNCDVKDQYGPSCSTEQLIMGLRVIIKYLKKNKVCQV